jgi:hypothetical protein
MYKLFVPALIEIDTSKPTLPDDRSDSRVDIACKSEAHLDLDSGRVDMQRKILCVSFIGRVPEYRGAKRTSHKHSNHSKNTHLSDQGGRFTD